MRNPFVLQAVALVLGIVLASCLPRWHVEGDDAIDARTSLRWLRVEVRAYDSPIAPVDPDARCIAAGASTSATRDEALRILVRDGNALALPWPFEGASLPLRVRGGCLDVEAGSAELREDCGQLVRVMCIGGAT